MNPVQIKICGITKTKDARACAELGAQLIGLNFYPQSPRYIKPSVGREIVESLPAETEAVGVFVDGNAEEIRETAKTARVRCVQLHGNFSPEIAHELASEFRVMHAFARKMCRCFQIATCSLMHTIPICAAGPGGRVIGLPREQRWPSRDSSFFPVV